MRTAGLILIAALAVTGCARAPVDGGIGGLSGNGTDDFASGGANDPTSVAYFQQNVGDRVLFQVDQATVTQEGRNVLSGQARWLNANPEYTALIEGHADEQGTREYNLALGGRRANAVRDFLVSQGVGQGRMRTISYGKERPLQICSTEECYSQNRRAVTVLATGAGV
ncbi:MAG: peptidoglycan-associated lipoprotein Pal [Jannaschia sp.]